MYPTQTYNAIQKPSINDKNEIADFLLNHLDQFGDKKEDILKAIDFSVKDRASFGGFTMVARDKANIVGAVVVNETGMDGYIPENILVYIATHRDYRGKGLGKSLMKEAIDLAKGNIALHVEPNNPAKYLYEKLGFDNKYLEMRLNKTK
ncbi:MAG: GNAT family N-acetyltransferase [Bacteroidetes bacterium HGW-Bacteroidetes-9]|jgi:GNAT superfamily N-acetyltransferase|nr:MAG: GNAT family N-acetyltransferase [Bacteroidetes bacterium HGW-Bacteroidetes-9]